MEIENKRNEEACVMHNETLSRQFGFGRRPFGFGRRPFGFGFGFGGFPLGFLGGLAAGALISRPPYYYPPYPYYYPPYPYYYPYGYYY
jgi:hypothetical protein